MTATASKQIFPDVQKLLVEWKGKEIESLQRTALAVGRLVGTGVVSFRTASEILLHAAKVRGYFERYSSDDVADCVESSLRSGQFSQAEPANDNDQAARKPFVSTASLSDLAGPQGAVGEIANWITSSSSYPSPELSLGPALGCVATLIGRKHASPSDARTNLYMAALAPSGYGKEHARTQLKRLFSTAGLERFSGPSRYMSASALRRTIMSYPSCFSMVDEFGGMMRQINDHRASIHSQLIRNDLLELFSSSATYFEGAAYANTPAERIYNPNFSMYGTSTPEDFWASVSSANAADGLLARMLLFNVVGPKPDRIDADISVRDVPKRIVEVCQELAQAGVSGGSFSASMAGDKGCRATAVPYTHDAEQAIGVYQAMIEEKVALAEPSALPFLNRAVEHAIKLALVVSVGTNWNRPAITGEAMDWACQLSWLSTCNMIEETRDRLSDNAREADLKRILGHVKNAGDDGITEGMIADRCASIDRNKRMEILSDLQLAGRIEERRTPTGGRPKVRYYIR